MNASISDSVIQACAGQCYANLLCRTMIISYASANLLGNCYIGQLGNCYIGQLGNCYIGQLL